MMATHVHVALKSVRDAGSRKDAVRAFLGVLEAHGEHIADVKERVDQVYLFRTPSRPVFQFDVTGFEYRESGWVGSKLDRLLDRSMQGLVFKLESMPESDFVPLLHTGIGKSDLIPRMFGVTFDYPPDGSVIPQFRLIEELPRDLLKLQEVDVTQSDAWRDAVERVRFLVEATCGQVEIAYPQMQGPLTNAPRLMDHTEMLIACHADPESMRVLANVWADVATRLILALQETVDDPALLRPRARFYQPRWIRGLIVGDYLALMRPEQYYDICVDAWAMMSDRLGPIFYHTCGPVWRSLEVLKKLPGLASFECTYVRGQTGTTADLRRVKERLAGRIVLNHFEWPLDGTVQDTENLTAEWLREMSRGGGFMMQDSGPLDKGRHLFAKLELI
jgi:hypothetical protein